jgi:uncharacterized repeat protein (TIGR04052 family)
MAVVGLLIVFSACEEDDKQVMEAPHMHDFTVRFAAVDSVIEVGCGDTIGNLGPGGTASIEISDLRFYVSNIRLYDAAGDLLAMTFDSNEFQYATDEGNVALIDLTDSSAGACAGDGITYPEGTARTNSVITGMVDGHEIARVTFDVGIPQLLMKDVIADNTAEGAPSPLAEMHWSWAYAYRFFVMNFVVHDGASDGEGYLHIGSNDCGGDGTKALTDRDACGKVNAAAVSLDLDPERDKILIDIRALLAGLDMLVDNGGTAVTGCECHSSATQPDCATVFANFGIDQATGSATANLNTIFKVD